MQTRLCVAKHVFVQPCGHWVQLCGRGGPAAGVGGSPHAQASFHAQASCACAARTQSFTCASERPERGNQQCPASNARGGTGLGPEFVRVCSPNPNGIRHSDLLCRGWKDEGTVPMTATAARAGPPRRLTAARARNRDILPAAGRADLEIEAAAFRISAPAAAPPPRPGSRGRLKGLDFGRIGPGTAYGRPEHGPLGPSARSRARVATGFERRKGLAVAAR